MDETTKLIICLGNPGPRYADTPHNLGWMVGDELAARSNSAFQTGKGKYLACVLHIADHRALAIKPTTYMNLSGHALVDLRDNYDFSPSDLVVVTDDIALTFGQLRIRGSGSSGGHNGLASIIEYLATDEFARVRCGVGPVPEVADPADFVLAPFTDKDLSLAREMAARAASAVELIVTDGVPAAANIYNRKPPAPEAPNGDQDGADRPREVQ